MGKGQETSTLAELCYDVRHMYVRCIYGTCKETCLCLWASNVHRRCRATSCSLRPASARSAWPLQASWAMIVAVIPDLSHSGEAATCNVHRSSGRGSAWPVCSNTR